MRIVAGKVQDFQAKGPCLTPHNPLSGKLFAPIQLPPAGRHEASKNKKMAPLLGPCFKEARKGGTSEKRMQGTVLRHRTACRELSRTVEESEGHLLVRPL